MRKILKWTGIVIVGLAGLTILAGLVLYPIGINQLNQSYLGIPVETIDIPTGREAVAGGRHVAVVWGCTKCHGAALGGMLLANDPVLGTIPAANLTSGRGGIAGSYSDADWIRAIRHGVKPNGRAEIFMYEDYATMSDRDLGDLIAYLKQIQPVDSDYPGIHFGPGLGAAPAIGLFTPAAERINHGAPHLADPPPGATVKYGEYLSVLCFRCHSKGLAAKMKDWKRDDFIRAIQTGVLPNRKQLGPAMPLKTYSEMNNTELTALWYYLMGANP
jgi:mono/diheme cytochrome c family protein